MATLTVARDELVVELTPIERLAAFRREVRLSLADVRSVCEEPDPWSALRGIRAPGTGIPGVLAYGVRRMTGGAPDFAALHGHGPAVRVECEPGARFSRLLVSVAEPARTVAEIRVRMAARPAAS
ncbi:MAG TPA: hypothetical protein VKV27_15695 [Solirubrobacteraceae bacterium]|nr:hypothetical protein [Solirubrobacteraceae bacterium]